MTKSTITREQLEEWVAQFDEDGGCDATDRQLEALIRQSLAAMDSEPVAWTWHYREQWHVTNDEGRARDLAWDGVKVEPLYRHAQPALVVPDELKEAAADFLTVLDEYPEQLVPINRDSAVVRALRAAMLAAAQQEVK